MKARSWLIVTLISAVLWTALILFFNMKVSVIMPTYNRAKWLPRAVESFVKQDYKNKELIILDNGSTDNTEEVLRCLGFPEENITIIAVNENNPRSLNVLWNLAKGDLICQLHDDDTLTKDSLSLRVKAFEISPTLEVVYGSVYHQDENETRINFLSAERPNPARILNEDYINFTSLMWRNHLKNKFMFDEDFEFNTDWMFKIRCLKECNVDFVGRAVMNYTIHPGQETHRSRRTGAHAKEMIMLKEKVKRLYENN